MKLARALLPLFIGLIAACAVLLLLQVNLTWAVIESKTQTTVDDFNQGAFFRTGMTRDDDGEVTLLRQGVAGEWITNTAPTGLVPRYAHAAIIYNNRYYVFGGRSANNSGQPYSLRSIQYAPINTTTHRTGVWVTATLDLPTNIYTYTIGGFTGVAWLSAVELNGRVYLLGGEIGNQLHRYSRVNYASIDAATGELVGPWTIAAPLPQPLSEGQVVVLNGYIYYVGGRTNPNNQGTNLVYYAKPDPATGAISQWFTATAPIPYKPYAHMSVATQNNHLYIISGINESSFSGGAVPNVYFAEPSPSTGDIAGYTSTVNLPRSITGGAAVYYGGQFYLTGGWLDVDATAPSELVFSAFEEEAGGVVTWTSTSALDPARALHSALANTADGWLYVVGGSAGDIGPIRTGVINVGATTGAGGTAYARSGTYRSADFDLIKNYQILNLNWTAVLSNPSGMTLTLRYRTRPGLTAPYSPWSAWFPSNPVLGVATTTVPLAGTARFLQYEAFFSTTNTAQTPILHRVEVVYDRPQPPQFKKSAVPASGFSVKGGDRITYTLLVSNTTGGPQTQVIVVDVVPTGTTYVPGSIFASPGVTPTVLGNNMIWDVGVVPADESRELGFVVTVNEGLPDGTVINNRASYDSNTIFFFSNSTSHYIGQPARIFKSHTTSGLDYVQPGDMINYTLIYSNPSSAVLSNVIITDALPPQLSFVSGTPAPDGVENGVIRWLISSIPANMTGTVSFVAQVTSAAADGTIIHNVAELGAPQRQTVYSDPDDVNVRYRYDLQMTHTVDKIKAPPGSTLNYTFQLTNATQVDLTLTNVVVEVYLAPGLPGLTRTLVVDCAAPCTGWSFGGMDVEGYLLYTRTVGMLGPNQSAQLTMQALIANPLPEDVLAVAAYSGALDDGRNGFEIYPPNQFGESITTVGGPDIEVQQLKSPTFFVTKKNFTVQAVVANSGFANTRGPDGTGWFGVDLYVKKIGEPPPSGPPDRYLGACPTTDNPCPSAIRWEQYKGAPDPNNLNLPLPANELVTVTYQISVPVEGIYWLYLQADTYWNDPGQAWVGVPAHGRIFEGNEVNNIYGPFVMAIGQYKILLPLVRR
jgi:uncharacterized repeat protein (TIGR01451 family)